jgi:hypothetical protein
MVTWTTLALAAVLVVRALSIVLSRRNAVYVWTALALVIGAVAALTLPGNLMALRANRVSLAVTEAINWEVVQGDITPSSDARRCELYEELGKARVAERARVSIYTYANAAFEHYHGRAFCSDPQYPGGHS